MIRNVAVAATLLLVAGCGAESVTDTSAPAPAKAYAGEADTGETAPRNAPTPPEQQRSSGLRAGSVDDNVAFADYLKYREKFADWNIPVRDIDVRRSRIVTVVDQEGRPLPGASVRAGQREVRTFADGRAVLTGSGEGTVTYGNASVPLAEQGSTKVPVSRPSGRPRLQVLFLIDTTGSMQDEIDRLKTTVATVAQRINDLADLEFGMTLYRDRGDAYVTRTTDFTPSVDAFQNALAEVQADGGGDVPEDLNAALAEALDKPSWRDETLKLVFLIADAPPHLDYQDEPDYATSITAAARRGIKIEPIASSGLDDQGEYVYRQLAQLTMGRFTFLTYGADGGSSGDNTRHHVSEYAVLSLDDLVVRLVQDELKPLR